MLNQVMMRARHDLKITMILFTILVTSTIAGQNFVTVFGYRVTSGTLIYPLTFPLVASLTELYGFRYTRSVIWTGAACNLIMALIIFLSTIIPSTHTFVGDVGMYHRFCSRMAELITLSTLAYLVSEYANAWIISRLGILTQGKFLLLRAFASISTAAAIDTWIIFPLFLSRQKYIGVAAKETFIYMLIKILMEVCLLPLFWIIVEFVKHKEGGYSSEIPDGSLPFTSVHYMQIESVNTGK